MHPHTLAPPTQGHDALFAAELKKYDPLSEDIRKAGEAQAELLARVDRDNKVGVFVFLGVCWMGLQQGCGACWWRLWLPFSSSHPSCLPLRHLHAGLPRGL